MLTMYLLITQLNLIAMLITVGTWLSCYINYYYGYMHTYKINTYNGHLALWYSNFIAIYMINTRIVTTVKPL